MPLPPVLSIDQIAATYERLLQEEGKQAAHQFVVDHLLAKPEPYLLWYCNAARQRDSLSLLFPKVFVNEQAPASLGPEGFGVQPGDSRWLGIDPALQSPAWLPRMNRAWNYLKNAWEEEPEVGVLGLPPRWYSWWFGSFEEMLTVYYVAQGGAPAEDYSTIYWEGTGLLRPPDDALWVEYSPLAAEFIFRGGAYDLHEPIRPAKDRPTIPESQVDLSAAVAHGVWYRREYTWCDTPVGGTDSPSSFSRTARGFLRLPNLCPHCEQFYREQIARPGGLREFARLQRLDMPETLRTADLALLDDPDIMLGDKPLSLRFQEVFPDNWTQRRL